MSAITGQVNQAQQLENLDYDLYVNNVFNLLSTDQAKRARENPFIWQVLYDNYLPVGAVISDYRVVAEKVIGEIGK